MSGMGMRMGRRIRGRMIKRWSMVNKLSGGEDRAEDNNEVEYGE